MAALLRAWSHWNCVLGGGGVWGAYGRRESECLGRGVGEGAGNQRQAFGTEITKKRQKAIQERD